MNKKYSLHFIALFFLLMCVSFARAQDISKLLGAIKEIQKATQPVTQPAQVPAQNAAQNSVLAQKSSRQLEPAWLPAYPRSELYKEFVDPLQRTQMPLTLPAPGAKQTKYSVSMEGKVTMLQYKHQTDDSPLLIQRHYDAFLAQAGYERILVCTDPCPANGGAAHWMGMLDPNRSVDYFQFPNAPTVLVGHKENSMAFVAIGKSSNAPYATYIKLVEGSYLNKSELTAYLDSLKPIVAPTPPTPAIVATPSAPPKQVTPPTQNAGSTIIETVAPDRIKAVLSQTRGKAIVLFSSRDTACPYCIRTNPKLSELAGMYPDAGRFLAVYWEPWFSIPNNDFFKALNFVGVPAYMVFEDDKVLKRVNGDHTVPELATKLF